MKNTEKIFQGDTYKIPLERIFTFQTLFFRLCHVKKL